MWRRFTDPALGPHERLFFEIYGQALQGRPARWISSTGSSRTGSSRRRRTRSSTASRRSLARTEARLSVAVIRGLLLDWLATGEHDAVNAAFERYVAIAFRDPGPWAR